MAEKLKPIVVALDPSERETRRTRLLFQAAKLWQKSGQKIQPVSVISPLDIGWPVGIASDMQAQLTAGVVKRVTHHLRAIEGIEEPQIVYADGVSLSSTAHALTDWSTSTAAEVIFTYAHTGAKPKLSGVGSFTERLIGKAGSHVVVIGSRAILRNKISRIVFATDFSDHSEAAFKKVVELAGRWQAEIVLFHHLTSVPNFYSVNAYGVVLDPAWVQEFMNAESFRLKQKGEDWAKFANQRGTPCRFVLDEGANDLAGRIKVQVRRERADLLALSINRTATAQIFLGRALRGLFSLARCPVLVMNERSR